MALARRNGKDAVQAFRTVLHDQPELATVHFLLGQAYLLTGETNLAKESFEHARGALSRTDRCQTVACGIREPERSSPAGPCSTRRLVEATAG